MRRIQPVTLGLAVAIGAAIFWTLCSIVIALAPGPMPGVTSSLFHVRGGFELGVSWTGYFVGLAAWSVAAGVFAWICAALYDRMLPPQPAAASARR